MMLKRVFPSGRISRRWTTRGIFREPMLEKKNSVSGSEKPFHHFALCKKDSIDYDHTKGWIYTHFSGNGKK
jgi:hypothetical protein